MLSCGKNITAKDDVLKKVPLTHLYNSLRNPKEDVARLVSNLRIVRTINSKLYSELKRRLPYIVCAHFNPPHRKSDNFAYTEYFIIDIDHLSSKELSVSEVKSKLMKDDRIMLLFLSPGEDGLKAIFKLTQRCYDAGLYAIFYKHFLKEFSKEHNLEMVIDTKTSDVSRACFISIDADAYYNPSARCVNMYDYASPDNPQALFEIKRETEKEEKTNTPQIKSTADDEAIKKIKALLNPKSTKPEKPEPYIPEQLNEIMDELQTYLNNAGVILYEVKNIQYGKKLRLKVGSRLGEINLFYGKHGFSVVRSPRTGTSAEVNELMSALIEEFLISLI